MLFILVVWFFPNVFSQYIKNKEHSLKWGNSCESGNKTVHCVAHCCFNSYCIGKNLLTVL